MVPEDVCDGFTSRVPLHRLKKLRLCGLSGEILPLLEWMNHPDEMDFVHLDLSQCIGESISDFFEPYLWDRIRRDGRFKSRLGIRLSGAPDSISFRVGTLGQFDALPTLPGHGFPLVSFAVEFRDRLLQSVIERLCTNLLTVTPQERVVEFIWGPNWGVMEEINLPITVLNIESLHLLGPMISGTFLQPDQRSHTKLLPSLRHLYLGYPTLQNDDDWRPLITCLTHQTSGGQAISLDLHRRGPPVPPEVVRKIEGLVDRFNFLRFVDEGYWRLVVWGR